MDWSVRGKCIRILESARLASHPCNHGQPTRTSSQWEILSPNPISQISYNSSFAQIISSPASNGFKHLRAVRRGRRYTAAGLRHANVAAARMGTRHRGYGCHQNLSLQKLLQGSGMWLLEICGDFNFQLTAASPLSVWLRLRARRRNITPQ